MHLRRRLLGEGAKFRRELHLAPPFARRVKDGPALHGTREHFFEAKRLGAKLHVVVFKLPPLALLVFHRDQRFRISDFGFRIYLPLDLDDVALPAEPETLRPDGERAEQGDALGDFVAGQVRVLVREIADERVDICPPQSLDDLQPRPPIAEEEVVEQRERQRFRVGGFRFHDLLHRAGTLDLRVVCSTGLCQFERMEITVTKPIEEFIEQQLARGYANASEVTRQAFLRWMEDEDFDAEPPRLREKIEAARQGKFRPYDPQSYDALLAPADATPR